MIPAAAAPPEYVPALRADLVFADAGTDGMGMRGVIIHDPLRHRFFRVPVAMAMLLNHWNGTAKDVVARSGADESAVRELSEFLVQSRLIVAQKSDGILGEHDKGQRSFLSRVVHSYLSFRIPVVNPEPFLDATLPLVRPLAARLVFWCLLVTALLGLYFAGRQWDHFLATFLDFFSPQGAVLYGVTLVGLKVFHELGHGFVARHFGCHVPVMGINFMVLTPMLYTEASDAWRLSSRRQRFLIGAAGIAVELALAALALLLWAFLPDGPLRSACYFVAATAWLMSLFVNLSPFMRFDGYHMLVDATGLQGIGPRSFALATWHLRDVLFRTGEAMPEYFPPLKRWLLISLAWGTWIYRLVLFGGIALLVYHMFPKLLGLPLAIIEIHWFILKPIIRELKDWKEMGVKNLFGTIRAKCSAALLLLLLVLAALPLDRHVAIPAVMFPTEEARIFAPEAAQALSVETGVGDRVQAGDVLLRLASPDIDNQLRMAGMRLSIVETKLARLAADAGERTQRQVLEEEHRAMREELDGLKVRADRLVIRSPISGIVREQMNGLARGQWLPPDQQLLHVVNEEVALLDGLVEERESGRILAGAAARFVGEDGMGKAISARVVSLGVPGGEGEALAYLSSSNGGPITTAPDGAGGRERPVGGFLPVRLATESRVAGRAVRGTVTAEATPRSLFGFVSDRVVTVFLRESGF